MKANFTIFLCNLFLILSTTLVGCQNFPPMAPNTSIAIHWNRTTPEGILLWILALAIGCNLAPIASWIPTSMSSTTRQKKSYPALTPLLGVKPPWDLSEKLLCDHTISDAAFQTVYEFGTGGLVAVEPDTYLCCNFKLLLPKIEDM